MQLITLYAISASDRTRKKPRFINQPQHACFSTNFCIFLPNSATYIFGIAAVLQYLESFYKALRGSCWKCMEPFGTQRHFLGCGFTSTLHEVCRDNSWVYLWVGWIEDLTPPNPRPASLPHSVQTVSFTESRVCVLSIWRRRFDPPLSFPIPHLSFTHVRSGRAYLAQGCCCLLSDRLAARCDVRWSFLPWIFPLWPQLPLAPADL